LWDRARVSFPKNQKDQKDPKETFALEVRPEEVKVLYARVLALQSLMDGRLDPREIEYLYAFMSRVSMSSDSREEVRQTLAATEASPENVALLVEEVISAVPDNQEELSVSTIKDMVRDRVPRRRGPRMEPVWSHLLGRGGRRRSVRHHRRLPYIPRLVSGHGHRSAAPRCHHRRHQGSLL
jgi:hypothetical protein